MKHRIIVLAALSIATLRAAEPPVFEGYMIAGDRPQFMLSDGKGKKSGWLTLGERFENFTLVALQADEEALLVEKDGKRQLLKLRQGTILASKPESLAARVRSLSSSLTGLAFAKELVKLESELTERDDKAGAANLRLLLQRYEEALAVSQTQPGTEEAMKFLRAHVDRMSSQLAARILSGADKKSSP